MGIALQAPSSTPLLLSHILHNLAHQEVGGKQLEPGTRGVDFLGMLGRTGCHQVSPTQVYLVEQGILHSEHWKRCRLLGGL